jgi:hypothetical protein
MIYQILTSVYLKLATAAVILLPLVDLRQGICAIFMHGSGVMFYACERRQFHDRLGALMPCHPAKVHLAVKNCVLSRQGRADNARLIAGTALAPEEVEPLNEV